MKGVIFKYLEEFVVSAAGEKAWMNVVEQSEVATPMGAYVSHGYYPDEELLAIVSTGSKLLDIPIEKLVFAFGEFLLTCFARDFPKYFEEGKNAKSFLHSVDCVIHVEVKMLYPEVELPEMDYEDPAPEVLVLQYSSARQLCILLRGLIQGVGDYFKEKIDVLETKCMHQGHDHCRFELTFQPA